MQNWNPWQLSAGAVATTMPQPPVGYPTPGVDPTAMMQAYMQYYSQPAPNGYTAEQWTAAQQQSWAQWQQWQQQYQQWQAQYGEKYQETMKHLSAQNLGIANQAPPLPTIQPPPLPKEDTKPPLPPNPANTYQFTNVPPPHQNNLPLFPAKEGTVQTSVQNFPQNPPLPTSQPPLPPENSSNSDIILPGKRVSNSVSESSSAKKFKIEDDELTEAEKTFDAQFKQWEEQFNKWKQQNANHPDKTQYKQYEAKWTSWREKLIERREQMRKKREQQKLTATKADAEKNKNVPGDDKILNILSSTENQGLINNLLGIGKTLGLTGKQNTNAPPPPPPPIDSTALSTQAPPVAQQLPVTPQGAPSQTGINIAQSPWNSQQWPTQYNAGINASSYPGFQSMTGVSSTPYSSPMPAPNFAQPPPHFSSAVPNFSQPPPGFSNNDLRQQQSNPRPLIPPNMQRRPPFGSGDGKSPDVNLPGQNERPAQPGPNNSFDPNQPSNFGLSEHNRQEGGGLSERFGRDGINKGLTDQQGNQFRPNDSFGMRNENFNMSDDRGSENDQHRREDRNYQEQGNNQFNAQKSNFNNDRFGSGNDRFSQSNTDRFGPGNNRFGSGNDRFGPGNDRFGPGNDRFGSGSDRSGSGNDRFGAGNDRYGLGDNRFGSGNDRFGLGNDRNDSNKDRFGANTDWFVPGNEFNPSSDRFNRNNLDRFDQKDASDANRRDSFLSSPRNFNRNSQFEPSDKIAPELKKLMEKRRAAMDVFKPSYLESDKCTNVGSLSESFKKIAGDSPFAMKSTDFPPREYGGPRGNNNFGPRGPPNFGPPGPGNFRMSGDFKPLVGFEFAPRGPGGFGPPNSAFDLRDGPPMRGPNSSPSRPHDFAESKSDITNTDKDNLRRDSVQEFSPGINEHPRRIDQGDLLKPGKEKHIDDCTQKDISVVEKLSFDSKFTQENLLQKDVSIKEGEDIPANFENPCEEKMQTVGNEVVEAQRDAVNTSNTDGAIKKSDVLPFMGENDPKPEDLNMEPPPELPNLGPISSVAITDPIDSMQRPEESIDIKVPSLRTFPPNSECFDPRSNFDNQFGPRGMPFKSNPPPLLGLKLSNDSRFPPFEPRGPNPFLFNPSGSPHLRPRGFNEGQFGPRGPNEGQFGPRGPPEGIFGPRGPPDGMFGPRGPIDGQFGPRDPKDSQFGPRGPSDTPFGSRGPNDGLFGPRGKIDVPFPPPRSLNEAQFPQARATNEVQYPPPRGPNENQIPPRGPIEGPFGPRGPNEGPFGPRGPNDGPNEIQGPNNRPFDNRGPGEGQFGARGTNEGPSNFPGTNDRFAGPRKPNDEIPFPRGPNDNNTFVPRGLYDGPFSNRGPKDGPYGSRGFNERLFDAPKDGFSGPQSGNDRFLGPRGPMNVSNEASFPPRNHSEGQFIRQPFDMKGPGDYRPRGQFNNSPCPPPTGVGAIEKHLDRGVETGVSDIRGEGLSNLQKSLSFNANDRMQMEQNLDKQKSFGPGNGPGEVNPIWRQTYQKGNFADTEQRPGRDPGYDQRSQQNKNEMFNPNVLSGIERRPLFSMGKPAAESSLGSDYVKFAGSNMGINRLSDIRQPQGRCLPVKEFCIQKQFNYNHGGASVEKKFIEHIPAKVIDYAHTSRSSIQDYATPVQCFDYGHGKLKPVIIDRDVRPIKDFRNWEESEQNLKEYTDRIRSYERFTGSNDYKRADYKQRKDIESYIDDRRYDRERRERDDYKMKERREDRVYDRKSEKEYESRYHSERSSNKEKAQERGHTSHKEAYKENEKDEDRSKGNSNWQDISNKNVIETKSQDISVPDTQHDVSDSAPKTLELPKTPNCSMVDDLLCPPGRQNRPPKIVIILRGPPGSGKSFVAKLIKDKEVEQGGSAPRILSLDDYFLVEKEVESQDDNGKKVTIKEMVYEYEEAMEQSYITSLVKAFKKNVTDGFFNFIILDCINEKISDYEEMWSFAKTKGFKVYVCEMEMDLQICLKRNTHGRTEEEINRIIDYFEPAPSYHQKLDVNSMLQDQAIEEVHMEDSEEVEEKAMEQNEDSQDSQEDIQDSVGVSKWERMEAEDKLDRLDGLAKKKNEGKVQTMQDFLQVPDYYNMEDTSGKKRVRWADLEERKEQEKMRAVGFVVGHTNWDRMMDPTKGGSALTRTKFFSLS